MDFFQGGTAVKCPRFNLRDAVRDVNHLQRGTSAKNTACNLCDSVGNTYLLQGVTEIKCIFSNFRDAVGNMDLLQTMTTMECKISNLHDAVRKTNLPEGGTFIESGISNLRDTVRDIDLFQRGASSEGTFLDFRDSVGKMDLLQSRTPFERQVSYFQNTVGDMNLLQAGLAEGKASDVGNSVRDDYFRQIGTVAKCAVANSSDIGGNGRALAPEKQRIGLRFDDGIAVGPGIVPLVGGRHPDGFDSGAGIEGAASNLREMGGDENLLRGGIAIERTAPQFRDAVGNDRALATDDQRVRLRLDDGVAVGPGIIPLIGGRHRNTIEYRTENKGTVPNLLDAGRNVNLP